MKNESRFFEGKKFVLPGSKEFIKTSERERERGQVRELEKVRERQRAGEKGKRERESGRESKKPPFRVHRLNDIMTHNFHADLFFPVSLLSFLVTRGQKIG